MARIDRFGNTPQSSEELHEKNERAKVESRDESPKEEGASTVLGRDGVRKVIAPQDAERLVSQAGFARAKKKRPGEMDMGDSSQAPIPLPEDDVDASVWSAEALAQVQAQLGAQGGLLRAVRQDSAQKAKSRGAKGFWEAMVEAAYGDGGEEPQRLGALVDNPAPDAGSLAQMAAGAQAHFGLDLAGLEPGSQLLAASLLVAGQSAQVAVVPGAQEAGEAGPKQLDGDKLLGGVEAVLDGGRAAVDDGRRMNEGVSKNLAMHRTFVAKR
jgi:hypothetical protein